MTSLFKAPRGRNLLMSKALLAATCLSTPSALWAQDTATTEAEKPTETIIVVGQRETPITVVPRGLSVSLGRADFEAINAINVEDLMKYAPNFFVRKRFAGDDNAVVALRGANTVQSARTIVMVDGFLVSNFLGNSFSFSPKWNVVGPADVRQFDIVYGPYSARYGGNSMGGVVSITTEEPKKTGAYLNAQTMVMPFKEYGFDETFTGYSVEGGGTYVAQDGKLRVRAGFRRFDNVGQSMTYNLLTPATGTAAATSVTGAFVDPELATPVFGAASPVDVVQNQVRVRVAYDFAPGWTADAMLFGWTTDQTLADTRTFLKDANGTLVGQGRVRFNNQIWNATGLTSSLFERTEYLAGLKLTAHLAGWDMRTNLSRYWMPIWNTKTSRDYLTGQSNGAGTYQVQDNPGWYAADITFDQSFGRHNLGFGLNANRYETAQNTFNTTNWRAASGQTFASATAGKTESFGLWVEDAIDLTDTLTLTLGGRYDRWRAFDGSIARQSGTTRLADTYPNRTDSAFSPKTSIQAEIVEGIVVQLSLGSATRFPTVGELFQGRIDDITREIDPQSFDPNLRPERSTDMTLMGRGQLGPIQITASAFYQDIEDAIFSFSGLNQFGTVVSSFKNVDLVTQSGVELIFEAKDLWVDGLDMNVNLSKMDATTVRNLANPETVGKRFPRIPEWRSSGNFRYKISPKWRASLGWRHATTPTSDLFGREGSVYGFQTEYFFLDTRLTYDVTDKVQFNFGIDNLNNDQAYVSHPLPQRTFVFDVKLKR